MFHIGMFSRRAPYPRRLAIGVGATPVTKEVPVAKRTRATAAKEEAGVEESCVEEELPPQRQRSDRSELAAVEMGSDGWPRDREGRALPPFVQPRRPGQTKEPTPSRSSRSLRTLSQSAS